MPEGEKPTIAQLSAVRGKLLKDGNPVTGFGVCGPFGDRTARWMPTVEDVWVDEALTKRCVTAPPTFTEWQMCWQLFRAIMLILDASPPGLLDACEQRISRLNTKFPNKCGGSRRQTMPCEWNSGRSITTT